MARLNPLPADLASLRRSELGAARVERMSRGKELVGLGDDISIEQLNELQEINKDLERIAAHTSDGPIGFEDLDGRVHYKVPGSGRGGLSREFERAGWISGYWSEPAIKASTGTLTPSGAVTLPGLMGGIVPINDRPVTILNVLPVTQLRGTDTYRYLKETVRTHNAGILAASGTAVGVKPTSTYSVVPVDGVTKYIATLSQQIPRAVLLDFNLFGQYIETALREAVMKKLEDEVVNGDGTGDHLSGLTVAGNIGTTVAWSHDILQTARKALTALEANYIFDGTFVFSAGDWETLETLQTADGEFLSALPQGLPVDRAQRRLWGKPVVVSQMLGDGEAYLVDFANSTMLWEREGVQVDWSENVYDSGAGHTDFERNLIRFRAEGRWGFGVTRPAGVVKFATASS